MKVAALIARLLLGLVFLVFGLNGFLNFLPLPALTGQAGQFIDVLAASHFMVFVFTLEILGSSTGSFPSRWFCWAQSS
jgi:putative oxidoreductase